MVHISYAKAPTKHILSFVHHHLLLGAARPVLLAKDDHLELVIPSKDTSASNSTEDVRTSTLEEGLGALLCNNLLEGIQGTVVLGSLTRCHHHTTANSINGVQGKASTKFYTQGKQEVGKQVGLHNAPAQMNKRYIELEPKTQCILGQRERGADQSANVRKN